MKYKPYAATLALFTGVCASIGWDVSRANAQEGELPTPFLYDGRHAPGLPTRDEGLQLRIYNESPLLPGDIMLRGRPIRFTEQSEAQRIADRFVGHWRLVAYDRIDADGTTSPWRISGRLMYDADGNMAAQLMPLEDDGDEPTRRYFAYFGSYELDESANTVTHHVEASNIRRWVDTDLVRHYRIEDGNLILEVRDGERVTGRLTWERLDAE